MGDGPNSGAIADSPGPQTPSSESDSIGSSSPIIRENKNNDELGKSTVKEKKTIWIILAPIRCALRLITFIWSDPEQVDAKRFEDSTYESVDDYPEGYPSWAAFQNSDSTFRVYRRFGTLRNRVILYRQQELSELEDRLKELDQRDWEDERTRTRLASLRKDKKDEDSKRQDLIVEIDQKLKEYDDLLERETRSGAMQKASKRNYRTLVHYLWNIKPIVKREMAFLKLRDDFIILSAKPESPLEQTVDRIICNIPCKRIRQMFASENQHNRMKDEHFTHTSSARIAGVVRVVAIVLAVSLINIPIYFLGSRLYSDNQKRLVVVVAVALFPIALQITARPKNHEMFAITAAYCAVLTTCLATTNIILSQSQDGPKNLVVGS